MDDRGSDLARTAHRGGSATAARLRRRSPPAQRLSPFEFPTTRSSRRCSVSVSFRSRRRAQIGPTMSAPHAPNMLLMHSVMLWKWSSTVDLVAVESNRRSFDFHRIAQCYCVLEESRSSNSGPLSAMFERIKRVRMQRCHSLRPAYCQSTIHRIND